MTQQWLKCRVSKGMFSAERVITLNNKCGGLVCEFVPADQVQGQGKSGRVKVSVFTRDGVLWAVLPTVYSESVAIEPTQLVPA